MITWTKISDDNWIVKWKNKSKKFDDQMKVILWTLALDVKIDEIEYAMLELIKNDHNYAEFGVFQKAFVYSKRIG
jgi:hypothetical protein